MQRSKEELKAIEAIVNRLLIAVKEQEEKFGYLFWRHLEVKNEKE